MDYVGLDPTVGLECGGCKHIVRLPYSELLSKVIDLVPMGCDGCGHAIEHDWTTINIVQNIIRRRMREAQKAEQHQSIPRVVR
jgi:S-ribosylhomocysteine lyase LuxS involved in autoinducer biosynthesis